MLYFLVDDSFFCAHIYRFCKKKFFSGSQATVGIEFATRDIVLNNFIVKAQIWDTAGQERFQSMTKAYYKDAVGALLIYDITNKVSFEHIKTKWLSEVREFCHENITIVLVGNKLDDEKQRQVSISEAADFAESEGLDFLETSAQSGLNVEMAFRRPILLIARELPDIKNDIKAQKLPEGYIQTISSSSAPEYMNYWTNTTTDILPVSQAETGLIVTSCGGQLNDPRFRDSSM
jgi:small GTP-binding protein